MNRVIHRLLADNRKSSIGPVWRRSGKKGAVILSLAVAASSIVGVHSANASNSDSTEAQKLAIQDTLNNYYGALLDASSTQEDVRSTFGGAHIYFESGRMKLYVVGGEPAMSYTRLASQLGVADRLEYLPAKYSLATLEQARADLASAGVTPGQSSSVLSGQFVVGIAINDDASGLRVDVDRDAHAWSGARALSDIADKSVTSVKSVNLSDVWVVAIERPTPTSGSRNNDRSPWTGGAFIHNANYCSTGKLLFDCVHSHTRTHWIRSVDGRSL